MFVYKNTETIECLKKSIFQEKYRLHEQITREFLGLRTQNFKIVFM